jgi:hypothetical protein
MIWFDSLKENEEKKVTVNHAILIYTNINLLYKFVNKNTKLYNKLDAV